MQPSAATVLVVEDQPELRRICERALRAAGYHVLSASSGEEALDVVARSGVPDLLLTDVTMETMSGPDLARALTARRPGMKVLFMTGHTPNGGRPWKLPPDRLLEKPFSAGELRAAVAATLRAD